MCYYCFFFFFFNDTATTEIYTLSLHDALPISTSPASAVGVRGACGPSAALAPGKAGCAALKPWRCEFPPACKPVRGFVCRAEAIPDRSEEHTSELQSLAYLVCRLLLEKKKKNKKIHK